MPPLRTCPLTLTAATAVPAWTPSTSPYPLAICLCSHSEFRFTLRWDSRFRAREGSGPLLLGCALEAALGILSVVVFAEVTAYNSLAQVRAATSALEHWFLDLIWNLVTGVLPYAGPLVLAVWLHSELRRHIFAASVVTQKKL